MIDSGYSFRGVFGRLGFDLTVDVKETSVTGNGIRNSAEITRYLRYFAYTDSKTALSYRTAYLP